MCVVAKYPNSHRICFRTTKKREMSLLMGGHLSPPFETGFFACKFDCTLLGRGVYKSFGYKLTECCKICHLAMC